MSKNFTHLHLHTIYSALDGAIKIPKLLKHAAELGMASIAITDHGNMYGIIDFYEQCLKAKIKPIIGCEVYVSPGKLTDRTYERNETSNYHLVLLAENNVGLANLYQLSSIAFLEGFYRKPRIDKELLRKHSEGLIALSACLGGEVPKTFMKSGYNAAKDVALEYQEIMGKGNFYLELQKNGIAEQDIVNAQIINISNETGIPLVATCDSHYLSKADYISHEILMKLQFSQKNSDEEVIEKPGEDKKSVYTDKLYVKSAEEMWEEFKDTPSAVENTNIIAERCNVNIALDELHLPQYDVPDGYTISGYFTELANKGLDNRLKKVDESLHASYRHRLETELEVIIGKGFDGYFLIVWDFINYSRRNHIPVGPGRGSGAGSLVAYSIEITDIDPIKYNLLFERFLNPERVSMPDFDIDFCTNRRGEVINYVTERYGKNRVSQIVTFGTLKPRMAVRDVGRIIGVPLADVDKLAKAIPGDPTIVSFEKAFEANPALKEQFSLIDNGNKLLEHAQNLEGLIRNIGMHAAGVVISDKPLTNYAPLCKGPNGETIVQFEKNSAEHVGLIKFDFLGLKNLTIIDDAVRYIKANSNPGFDILDIPIDDKDVFEMLQRGDADGVFQLESEGMKGLLKKLKPTVFEDIIAVNALYRPGPIGSGMLDDFVKRKHGEQQITYPLPIMEDILKETYGIIVYQEQVMQIARTLGGYSLGAADILRRAMGKKKAEIMAQEEAVFINGNPELNIKGAKTLGYDEEIAREVFRLMAMFAEYGFNKSHSAAYALIAYQTAYLKNKYPLEYFSALLTCSSGDIDEVVKYYYAVKNMGVEVLPPNINKSFVEFRIEVDSIRYGLGAVKNIGAAVIQEYVKVREEGGEFKSIYDLCKRVDYKSLNKKTLEALIKSGAFDVFGKNRRQHLQVLEECLKEAARVDKLNGAISIEDFFDEEETIEYYPDVQEMPEKELLAFEKEVMSIYISSHPLNEIAHILQTFALNISDIKMLQNDSKVIIAGVVKSMRNHITKVKREPMAFAVIEDLTSDIEVVIFPRTFANVARHIVEDNIVVMKATVDRKEDKVSLRAEEVYDFGESLEKFAGSLILRYDMNSSEKEKLMQLKTVMTMHSGNLPIKLSIEDKEKYKVLVKLPNFTVKPSQDFFAKLAGTMGYLGVEVQTITDMIFAPTADYIDTTTDDVGY